MDALTRRKNGEWQCKFGDWHTRKQDCQCAETKKWPCKKCGSTDYTGAIREPNGVVCDDCWARRWEQASRIGSMEPKKILVYACVTCPECGANMAITGILPSARDSLRPFSPGTVKCRNGHCRAFSKNDMRLSEFDSPRPIVRSC
jgi:hypothetical protein